jgi:GTP-binding protein HflX
MQKEVKDKPINAVVAAVQLPSVSDVEFEASLAELRDLAKTLGFVIVATFTQKRSSFDSTAYLGTGKREEIGVHRHGTGPRRLRAGAPCRRRPDRRQDRRHFRRPRNLALAGAQPGKGSRLRGDGPHHGHPRNLPPPRRSRAARAQVEIARLGYMAPRLREAAKLAGPQGRQRSGTGGRGAGESHTELDRRKIRDQIAELQQEIVAMDAERKTQRARRLERQGLASVALVGYTNAGKSTLMRALTGSDVLVENKLFATLDTTVRALQPESRPRVLVSDTVGFIKNLPHGLVASFKSTLEEALDAALLLHVIDASDPGFERQLAVTDKVLAEIGAQDVPRLRVFNKIDHVGDAAAQAECEARLRALYPDCIVMSARRADDVAMLREAIVAVLPAGRGRGRAVPALVGTAAARRNLRQSCEVLDERADEDGAFLRVRGERSIQRTLH